MKLSFFLFVAVVLGVGGCAGHSGKSKRIVMQHPETMEFVNCKIEGWANAAAYAANEKCVDDLKQKGFIVWGEH